MNNLRCLYDSSEKQIIALKPNYECLMSIADMLNHNVDHLPILIITLFNSHFKALGESINFILTNYLIVWDN